MGEKRKARLSDLKLDQEMKPSDELPATRAEWKARWMKDNNATSEEFEEHFGKPDDDPGIGADGVYTLCR